MKLDNLKHNYISFKAKVRLFISVKMLNVAESKNSLLHKIILKIKPLKPILMDFNNKRKKQREDAKKKLSEKKIPDSIKINLSSIVFAIPFEYEHFDDIELILNKLNTEDERTYKSIHNIIKNKDNKDFRCIMSFGIIGGKKGRFSFRIKPIENIPKNVYSIELSYRRVMPSFAILIFKFNLLDSVTEEINNLQCKEYLSTIIFKDFFPISKLPYNYSTSWGQETKKAIDKYKDTIKIDIEQWIINTFKLTKNILGSSFFIDEFQINGNPTNKSELKQWLQDNRNWLNDYDFGCPQFYVKENFYTHYSSNTIIGLEPYSIKTNNSTIGKNINDDILSRVIVKSIQSTLNKHTKKIENIKAKVFKNIYKSSFKILNTNLSINDLTITMILLDRLEEELKQNKKDIKSSISEIGKPVNIFNDNEENNPSTRMIKDIFTRLKEARKELKILDKGINKILSTANTRAILVLTIVMAVLTVLGVCITIISYFIMK